MSTGTVQKKDASHKKSSSLKKHKKVPSAAIMRIYSTYNNNIICLTDCEGNVITSCSSGACGFKGTRKATPYAAQVTAEKVAGIGKELGVKCINIIIRGAGPGREPAVLAARSVGLKIGSIAFDIRLPHNGCRPRKKRRV